MTGLPRTVACSQFSRDRHMKVRFTVPDASDSKVALLAKALRARVEIRQAREVPEAEYLDTPPILVPLIDLDGARPLKCWFNVRDAVAANGGRAVFGWSLWMRHDGDYQAIHHGVWERPNGTLVDVTPLGFEGDAILFMADTRVPFDYEKLRAPTGFLMTKESTPTEVHYAWLGPKDTTYPAYGLLRMERDI